MAATDSTLTAREIVQNFMNLLAGGRVSDDNRFSARQWLFILDYHRAQLLRQEVEKGYAPPEQCLQELTVTVKRQPCKRFFTDKPLPVAIQAQRSNILTFVGTTTGHAFQKTTAQKAEWEQYAKYTKRKPKWYQLGNTLYLVTPPSETQQVLTVRGLFENPREVLVQNNDSQLSTTDYLGFPYPINRAQLDTIYAMMIDREAKLGTLLPPDYTNDSQEQHRNEK